MNESCTIQIIINVHIWYHTISTKRCSHFLRFTDYFKMLNTLHIIDNLAPLGSFTFTFFMQLGDMIIVLQAYHRLFLFFMLK